MKIFILTILFLFVNCEDVKPTCDRTGNVKYANKTVVIDTKQACKSKPCVYKCCHIDHYLHYNEGFQCIHKDKFKQLMNDSQIKFDFSDYPIHKSVEPSNETKADKDFFKDYEVLVNENFIESDCRNFIDPKEFSTRMLEDGGIYTRDISKENQKFVHDDTQEYCVDKYIFYSKKANETKYRYRVYLLVDNQENKNETKILYTAISMVISSFFMLLVLIVYSILKHLRNIQGMILMAYLATYVIANVLKASSLIGLTYFGLNLNQCKYLTPFVYGFVMSIFFWMNVMSFDIWWTFRATRKIRPFHRQGELMKFMWYGIYAWGTPTTIVIIAYCIDNIENDNILRPHFETCFNNVNETYIYLYVPIVTLIKINTLLFLITLYNLWLIKKAMSNYDPPRQGTIKVNQNRFWVYIKLSLIMGVGWTLEVIQAWITDLPDWAYIVLNTPNVLGGVAIFFMFVFKKAIYTKLAKKCKINNKSTARNIEYSGSSKSKTNNTESTGWTLNQQKHENIEA